MRLWSLQRKDEINMNLRPSIHRKSYDENSSNTKDDDKIYQYELDGKKYDIFYCYHAGKVYHYSFGSAALYDLLDEMKENLELDLTNYYLLELEVPQSAICSMKPSHYNNDCDIVHSDFLDKVREGYSHAWSTGNEYQIELPKCPWECVLPYIDNEWIVSYYTFRTKAESYIIPVSGHFYDHKENTNIFKNPEDTVKITVSILQPNKYPSIRARELYYTDYLHTPGFRFKNDKIYFFYLNDDQFQSIVGMQGCPRYYTIGEAMGTCNRETKNAIVLRAKALGMYKINCDSTWNTHIMKLFPDGMVDMGRYYGDDQFDETLYIQPEDICKKYMENYCENKFLRVLYECSGMEEFNVYTRS